jgi:hypothetical protein
LEISQGHRAAVGSFVAAPITDDRHEYSLEFRTKEEEEEKSNVKGKTDVLASD